MILILCAVMRLFMLSDSSRLAAHAPPPTDAAVAAFADDVRRRFPSNTLDPIGQFGADDEAAIGEILEPRGLDPHRRMLLPDSLDADPALHWFQPDASSRRLLSSAPVRRAALQARLAALRATADDQARVLARHSTVYPMRIFFCDETGVLEERVVDWKSPYDPR